MKRARLLSLLCGTAALLGAAAARPAPSPLPETRVVLATVDRVLSQPLGAAGTKIREAALPGPALHGQQITGVAVEPGGRLVVSSLGPCCTVDPRLEIFASATASAPPLTEIAGAHTGLAWPAGVAVDGKGTIYVADYQNGSVTEYAPGSSGDAAPARTISGRASHLWHPSGVAVDAEGDLYVIDAGTQSVEEFAPGASGDVAPKARIWGRRTEVMMPQAVAVGRGGEVFVATQEGTQIAVYRFAKNENTAPVRTIAGSKTTLNGVEGLAVGPDGTIYAADNAFGRATLDVFAPGATGNVAPRARLDLHARSALAGLALSG